MYALALNGHQQKISGKQLAISGPVFVIDSFLKYRNTEAYYTTSENYTQAQIQFISF